MRPALRWLIGLLVVALVALDGLPEAHARDKTYCVGGYTGRPPNATMRCSARDIRSKHLLWHFHVWVKRGDECFACFDEVDNSCEDDFLANTRRFRKVQDPWKECPQANTADKLLRHVIKGDDVRPPPPPKPKKDEPPPPPPVVRLTPRIDSISSGPYAAGDEVVVQASVRKPDGDVFAVPGGHLVVTTADGRSTRLKARVQRDGSLSARFDLPASKTVSVRFEPDLSKTKKHHKPTRTTTGTRSLTVDTCVARVRVDRPARGSALVVGQTVDLSAAWLDAGGARLPSPPQGARLTYTITPQGLDPIQVAADGRGKATWTVDPSLKGLGLTIRAGGRATLGGLCPGGSTQVTVTDLGLGLDTSQLPTTCFAGLPCKGDAVLVRPDDPDTRGKVDALLADPETEVTVKAGPTTVYQGPPPDGDTLSIAHTFPGVVQGQLLVSVAGPGGAVTLPPHDIDVRAPLKLDLPSVLDFGEVPAGTPFDTTCQPLDFSASTAAQEHRWRIEVTGLGDCEAMPVLGFADPLGQATALPLSPTVEVDAFDPDRPVLDICLKTTGCQGEPAPDGVVLTVTPLTPEFRDQSASVQLTWTVTSRSLLACYGWWVLPLLGVLLAAFILYGFIAPHRFPAHAAVRVAGDLRALRRANAISLVGLPGSGAGWYRSARLGLRSSGEITRDLRGATAVFRAVKGGLRIEAVGGLERHDRRSRRWVAVDEPSSHTPSSSTPYRSGDVLFKVEL